MGTSPCLILLPPSYENPCDHSGPTCIIQDIHPMPGSLTISPKFLLQWKVTYSQVPRIKTWTSLGEGVLIGLPQEPPLSSAQNIQRCFISTEKASSYKGVQGPA